MLTTRDRHILEFLQEVGAANSDQIARLFFADLKNSLRMARRRLAAIAQKCGIKRERDPFSGKWIYHTGKKQLAHRLLVTEFRVRLETGRGQLLEWQNEMACGNVRADAFAVYALNGKGYAFFVEVQIANQAPDVGKYEILRESGAWRELSPVFPRVVFITDRQVEADSLIILDTSLKEFENIFKTPVK